MSQTAGDACRLVSDTFLLPSAAAAAPFRHDPQRKIARFEGLPSFRAAAAYWPRGVGRQVCVTLLLFLWVSTLEKPAGAFRPILMAKDRAARRAAGLTSASGRLGGLAGGFGDVHRR